MSTDARFALTPSINIGRTRWHQKHDHPTSFLHGRCIPIDCVPVLPGDTFKLTLSSLIRMSTPIVPIMDNIRCNIYSFFVPMRLVWELHKYPYQYDLLECNLMDHFHHNSKLKAHNHQVELQQQGHIVGLKLQL